MKATVVNAVCKYPKQYIKENCTSKGEQLEGGITDAMKKGIEELSEAKKEHKVVIGMTDKSGKFTGAIPRLLHKGGLYLKTFVQMQ